MTGLVLVGAGGLAREVLGALDSTCRSTTLLLDDDPSGWGRDVGGAEVVGGLDDAHRLRGRQFVVCAGRGVVRRAMVERLRRLGLEPRDFGRVVHASAQLGPRCTVGHGSIVLAGVAMTADVSVGEHVVLMPRVVLTHDDQVSDFATLCAGVTLGGSVQVGTAAYLGMASAVRERTVVAPGTTLGMGAALLTSTGADETWLGVPARRLGSPRRAATTRRSHAGSTGRPGRAAG